VWSLRTRALMLQFIEHQRSAVSRILVDVQSPNLVHSSGLDGSVFTYDLKTEKRVNTHNVSAYTDAFLHSTATSAGIVEFDA
jgi:cilia- and flagella-associated protein 52